MITSAVLFIYFTFLHPLHLSVCDIYLNEKTQSVEISQRIFADDLESALRPLLGEKTDLFKPQNPEQLSAAIGNYVMKNFRLGINNKQANINYLGYELDEDVVWVYMEVPKVQKLNKISVRNTLFFEIFDDQLNLINVKKDGRIRSMKLVEDKEEDFLSF